MKELIGFLCISLSLLSCSPGRRHVSFSYPHTRKDTGVKDAYFDTVICDPYRWLEDERSAGTEAWVKAQQAFTDSVLESLPYRQAIRKRLQYLWNYERISAPFKKGGRYFFYKNDGTQNQSVLYVMDSIGGEAHVLIDPNKLSKDGTIAMGGFSVSRDGHYAAYLLSEAGSDWKSIRVMNLLTGGMLKDLIKWVKFSGISWKGNGFYYSAYDRPAEGGEFSGKNEFHKLWYHRIGDRQEQDRLVYEDREHPLRNHYAAITEDERFLLLYISESTSGQALYFRDLSGANQTDFTPIDTSFSHDYAVIDHLGDALLIQTNNDAPLNKLLLVDTKHPEKARWKTFLPETTDKLTKATICGDRLIVNYLCDVSTRLYVYDLKGKREREIPLPDIGMAYVSGKRGEATAFYTFVNYTNPGTIFKYDVQTGASELYRAPSIRFDCNAYVTEQLRYRSHDGTQIPLFITHKKDMKKDGKNPLFLYGYGGFDISNTPRFSIANTVFLENGGVYAVANIRGGGEYGEEWHQAGTLLNKQNVFDDFIAAAEFLISKGYTSKDKLAIHGRSNGGLLIGAVMTQRPDLFKVCIPSVGVLDMLRYHKFTIGWAWATDYGTSEDETQFRNLIKYSPLHNIKYTAYPATLITTADHDDRVVPAHSFKFAATLQEKQQGDEPVLIRIDTKAGHGGGKPTGKQIDEWTDIWTFVFYCLGMKMSD